MRIPLTACLLLVSSLCRAQGAADAQLGYVVKAEADKIVLDFSQKSGAAAGQDFTVFKEGEELIHPVTRAKLGRMENPVAEGTLREVFPSYSIGALKGPASEPVKPGMRARLKPMTAPPPQAQAPSTVSQVAQALGMTPKREPRWCGPAFEYSATALAVGDIKGGGGLQAAVSDGRKVYLYPYPPVDAQPLAVFEAPGTAPRIYSLEAADLDGDGRAEVFVSYFNDTFNRFESKVIAFDGKDGFRQTAEMPTLVRGYQDPKGERRLAVQQITEDASFPFGAIYPLVYRDGK